MVWKCSICGYVHNGKEAPDKCPNCSSPKEKFALLPEKEAIKKIGKK